MKGINIDNRECHADMIMKGYKNIETRKRPTLRSLVGQDVYIISTHDKLSNGHAVVRCKTKIEHEIVYNSSEEFDRHYLYHLVNRESKFYPAEFPVYGYRLSFPEMVDPFPVWEKGIVIRNIER